MSSLEHVQWGADLDQLSFAHVVAQRELTVAANAVPYWEEDNWVPRLPPSMTRTELQRYMEQSGESPETIRDLLGVRTFPNKFRRFMDPNYFETESRRGGDARVYFAAARFLEAKRHAEMCRQRAANLAAAQVYIQRAATAYASLMNDEADTASDEDGENTMPYWEEHGWVPRMPSGKQRSPNQIRGELQRYIENSSRTKTAIIERLGVNSNSFRKYMNPKTYKYQWSAIQNGTYWAAAKFLEAERQAKACGKRKAPPMADTTNRVAVPAPKKPRPARMWYPTRNGGWVCAFKKPAGYNGPGYDMPGF